MKPKVQIVFDCSDPAKLVAFYVQALDIVESKRLKDGRWRPEGYYWRTPGADGASVEAVDWGRDGPRPCNLHFSGLHLLASRELRGP